MCFIDITISSIQLLIIVVIKTIKRSFTLAYRQVLFHVWNKASLSCGPAISMHKCTYIKANERSWFCITVKSYIKSVEAIMTLTEGNGTFRPYWRFALRRFAPKDLSRWDVSHLYYLLCILRCLYNIHKLIFVCNVCLQCTRKSIMIQDIITYYNL